MGRRGEMIRCQKAPGDYYYGEYEVQVELLRKMFAVHTYDPEVKRAAEVKFNLSVDALRRRMAKFYGFKNKYNSDGTLKEAAYVADDSQLAD